MHKGIPFKFNRVWLEDEGFHNKLVNATLKKVEVELRVSTMHVVTQKLSFLKIQVGTWERSKKNLLLS